MTEIEECIAKADELYNHLCTLAKTPRVASTIIQMVHAKLWINCKAPNGDVEEMLQAYCQGIRINVDESNIAMLQ